MDSLPGEDPTLPLEFNGSVNIPRLPDISGDEIHVRLAGGGALPDVAEDTLSPTRARTMKDFENQIIELRKENFNLKLRIYFLEERIQQKFEGPAEDIYRINIELKVELESLKLDLQERDRLLIKASKAMESFSQGGDAEIQRVKEEAQKKFQQVEQSLTGRINVLEENLKMAQKEVEKAFAMTEQERVRRLAAEEQLSVITKMQPKDLDIIAVIEEKDRCIEQLSLSLKSQETLIQRLEEAKSQSMSEQREQKDTIALLREREQELEALRSEFSNEKNDLEKRIKSLQKELQDWDVELSAEKRNALKRDKTIQGLTLALKVKENENEELSSEIEELTVSLTKAREATHKAQMQNYKGAEDCQTLLMEKEALLSDLRSENLTKETENRKLQRKIKRTEQELNDLQLEKEKLVKELEEAQLQKSKSDKTINDLRNQIEKLQNQVGEKEKAVEHEYGAVLSENSEKLQSQELVIQHLRDSIAQKDLLLQKLDGVVKVKDAELLAWSAKFQSLLKDKEDAPRPNEGTAEETQPGWTQQPLNQMMQALEKMKAAESTEMFEAFWKEQDTLSSLIKSLKNGIGINDLQEELNNIFLLRKQLEDEILANWNLRKVLEEQIKANRKEDETVSSWGDQTSYLSICLREQDYLNLQIDHLSLEELKKKVVELTSVVKDLQLANTELKHQLLRFSSSDHLAEKKQEMLDGSEFLEKTEESRTLTEDFEEEMNAPSCLFTEKASKDLPPPSEAFERDGRNLSKPESERELAADKGFGSSSVDKNCRAQERRSPVSLLNGTGAALLGSRQEQMKIANKPLDHLNSTEPDSSSDDLENKNEEDLKQLIIQLRTELQQLRQVNTFEKQHVESKSARSGTGGLELEPALQGHAEPELTKVGRKDAMAQTMSGEGLRLNEEYQSERAWAKLVHQETFLHTSKMNKSVPCHVFRKSRLPVLLKSSRSLGSISPNAQGQKPDMLLQHRIFTLDEVLKDEPGLPQPVLDELQSSEAENERSAQDGVLQGARSLTKLEASEVDVSLKTGDGKGNADPNGSISEEMEASIPKSSLPTPEKLDPEFSPPDQQEGDMTTLSTISKSLLSLKPSCTSTDAIDFDAINDIEVLRHHIRNLETKLAKYRMMLTHFESTKQLPPSNGLGVIQNEEDLPDNQKFAPTTETHKAESKIFSGASDAEVLSSPVSEQRNEETVEKLKALLLENEAELEKEQIANLHLLDEVYHLQNKLKAVSPKRHDSPVSPPTHGDSCQRLKIQETFSTCVAYRQHLASLIRTFEELLQASEVDYCVAEGFREQLNQSVQLFERLERQCLYGESIQDAGNQLCGLTESLANFQTPQTLSSVELPGAEKDGGGEGEERKSIAVPAQVPPALLMEHLQEIRMLRHQLEESIQTNNRLRKRLEQQALGPVQDQDSANVCICGSEQHNSLTSEIHFLRKQNQVLNGMLAKGSQEKQNENEKLRESLSKKSFAVERLHKDCEHLKKENEKLQKKLKKREEENGHLTQDNYNIRNELNRLQTELNAKQHQLSENDKLLHSLRLELKVYEKLNEAIRSQKDCSHERSDECWKDESHQLDLHELLMEIRNLRTQLEMSVQANKMLHEKVEEQLLRGKREDGGSGSTVNISYLFKQDVQPCPGLPELKFPTADSNILELEQKYGSCLAPLKAGPELALEKSESSSRGSSSTGKPSDHVLVPRHCIWADKNGRHILGFVEDYNSLRKLISEGRKLLAELELLLNDPGVQELGMLGALNRLSPTLGAAQKDLDEAARLLKLLWRVSLPMKVVHGAAYSLQDESMRAELRKLRWKVAEQEKKLHSTVKRLHYTAQLKENMERVIIDQLALTHDVLKKARGNLEILPAEHKTAATSLSKKKLF